MAKLFFSYSHKDEALRDQVETHLITLERQGLIRAMHDRCIVAGAPLDPAIAEFVESADVILCLVSPDFLASEYCYSREMARALERHRLGEAVVIPVILRHCDWQNTPLGKLRGTPRDNKPVKAWADIDEALNDVASDVRRAVVAARLKIVKKVLPPPELRKNYLCFGAEITELRSRPAQSNLNALALRIVAQLQEIYDPEIPINIVDLGLIYKIEISHDHDVLIDMTLTSTACPFAEALQREVYGAVARTEGVKTCTVKLVFEPPWNPIVMSDEAKRELGML